VELTKTPVRPCSVCGRELFVYRGDYVGFPVDYICCEYAANSQCIVCCVEHRELWIRIGAIDDFEIWVADIRRKSAQCS